MLPTKPLPYTTPLCYCFYRSWVVPGGDIPSFFSSLLFLFNRLGDVDALDPAAITETALTDTHLFLSLLDYVTTA